MDNHTVRHPKFIEAMQNLERIGFKNWHKPEAEQWLSQAYEHVPDDLKAMLDQVYQKHFEGKLPH